MKKFVNDPRDAVREMLEGMVDTNPELALIEGLNVVIRADQPAAESRPVAVISGGGAGHEPAHAGFVGAGMLQAAVVGDVFTSPSADAVLAAILAVAGPNGALLIVKNYTGDRLNFGLAAELARGRGIPVELVAVADDVALHDTVAPERRRGIAGVVLVHKIAGALADSGRPLADVAAAARQAIAAIGTMGVALDPCIVPAARKPSFVLAEDEIELGLGIHGEPGVRRSKIQTADELASELVHTILEDRDIRAGDSVALLVNGLGGTPPMELAIMSRIAVTLLREAGVIVERAWTGTLLSALEMPGCSITLLPVDEALLAALDAPTSAQAWPRGGKVSGQREVIDAPEGIARKAIHSSDKAGSIVFDAMLKCADAFVAAEPLLTELDSAAGDGDLGFSMERGAAAVRHLQASAPGDAASVLVDVADTLRRTIAGSSGPFYAIGLVRAARRLASADNLGAADWADAFEDAVRGVAELGGAKPGDRTMLDALHPAAAAFKERVTAGDSLGLAWRSAVAAGTGGALATVDMTPRLGRASYLGARAIGVQDAGAAASVVWMKALLDD